MNGNAWVNRSHEFTEDPNDYSMCKCGIPGLDHDRVLAAWLAEQSGVAVTEKDQP